MATQNPANTPDPSEQQFADLKLQERMSRVGRKLLVLSGKGGVGKSTVAANLAVALANAGKRVGLLDVDVHGPSIPTLMGLVGRRVDVSADEQMVPVSLRDNLKVISIGLLLAGGDQPVIWRGPRKFGAIRQFLGEVEWGELDYLVVDSPPGTGDEPLAVAQLAGPASSAVIVTTPQDVAVADVRRCLQFCRSVELPVAGIVENMSGFVCPHCGERSDLFGRGGAAALANKAGVALLGQVPIDPRVVASGDEGTPFMMDNDRSPANVAFAGIVERLLSAETGEPPAAAQGNKENGRMRIAIPLAGGKLSLHFGHCEQFTLLDVDAESGEVLAEASHTPPPHEPGALPRWLSEMGAEVIIAGGMGSRAQGLFEQSGIRVVVGAPAAEPAALARQYVAGTLATGENVCDH